MKVFNKSTRMYQHKEYNLLPKASLEVPDKVAKLWLATGEVVEYADPKEVKAKEAQTQAEKKALEEENAKLKAELEKLKADGQQEAKAKEAQAQAEKKANNK